MKRIKSEAGFSGLALIMAILLLGTVGYFIGTMGSLHQQSVPTTLASARAFAIAQGGMEYTAKYLSQNSANDWTSLAPPPSLSLGAGSFTVAFTPISAGSLTATVTGSVDGGGGTVNRQVFSTFKKGGSPFQYAFAADENLKFDGAHTDSYDSSSNPNPSTFGTEGHIRTNKTGDKSIELKEGAYIGGNATVGPGGSVGDISIKGGAYVAGSKQVAPALLELPPVSMPAGGTPIDIEDKTQRLSAGTYRLQALKLDNGNTITINGNVTLYMNGKLEMKGDSQIVIASGSSLTIFINDEFKAGGGAIINDTQVPANFQIFGTPNCTKFEMKGDVVIKGAIYIPNAKLKVGGSADVFGAIVAKSIDMKGQAFHYDKALKNLSTFFGSTSVQASGWKEKI